MKFLLGFLVCAAAAVAASVWFFGGSLEAKREYRTLPVTRGDLTISVRATGTVEPVEVVDVGAQIVGRVQNFGPDEDSRSGVVDFGSTVKQGDVLAQLDNLPHRAEHEKAKANQVLARAELQKAEAHLKERQQDFERAERLKGTNAASEYDHAQAMLESSKADLAMAEARVAQAQIAVNLAEINLKYTTITAPIDGVVIDRRVNVGQTVVVGLNAPSLFLLARDLSQMRVVAAVDEADIGDVKVGQKVSFRVDAYRDETFTGTVSQVRLNAGMSSNVVTYEVIVDIHNTEGKLLPYMTANLEFEIETRDDAVLVPSQALRWRPEPEDITPSARADYAVATSTEPEDETEVEVSEPTLWVIGDDGFLQPVHVEVGLSDGINVELLGDDLNPDQQVVVNRKRRRKQDFASSFVERVRK